MVKMRLKLLCIMTRMLMLNLKELVDRGTYCTSQMLSSGARLQMNRLLDLFFLGPKTG